MQTIVLQRQGIEYALGTHPPGLTGLRVFSEPCVLRSEEGDLVAGISTAIIPAPQLPRLRETLAWAARQFSSVQRATYAGKKPILQGRNMHLRERVYSAICGSIEPQGGRFPFCRRTKLTLDFPVEWGVVASAMQHCNERYSTDLPTEYARHLSFLGAVDNYWRVPGTLFTTGQINLNIPSAYHRDTGDAEGATGVMLVLRKGSRRGYQLVLPEWGIALDPPDNAVVYFDPRCVHGNVKPPTLGFPEQRISLVCYVRGALAGCGDAETALKRAKARGTLL